MLLRELQGAAMSVLGPGPWTVQHVLTLTRDQVLAVRDAMPADLFEVGACFKSHTTAHRDRLADRACSLLKAAGLAHYDRAARVWRRTDTQEKSP